MTHPKTKISTAILATVALALSSTMALATVAAGDKIGTTENEIRSQLKAKGYEVKSIEIEDDEIEVEVALNDKVLEIEIDKMTGQVTEVEEDD